MSFPVTIQPEVVPILKRMLARKGDPDAFIRIGVKGGGCSGFEYLIKVDTKRTAFDLELELDGVPIISDTKSAQFIEGAVLAASGNLMNNGLKIENPNAARSCGCGTSFTPK
jgi:iron-sulfur cluster assembly protein